MLSFSDCQAFVETEITRLGSMNKQPGELYDPIYYILNLGGKRIRPVSSLMACNLFTEDVAPAIKPAVAMEVFHNFTLIHDDIMDNAAVRRNKPTVHERWNNNVGILSGDAMQIISYQLLSSCAPELLASLLQLFNTTALEVCEGQQYDMNFASRNDVTLDEYIRMIELKTSVLLAASIKMGALCGKAPEAEAQKLYEFGRNLGLAFQIQDDYLDVYADQSIFGKTIGGDIAENKKTFLLIKALELAKGKQAEILQLAIHDQIPDINEKIELVRNIYDQLDLPSLTRTKIEEFSQRAFENLQLVKAPEHRKAPLLELAQDLMQRQK
jgi:geranylgeranyl diphosphate synthase, type II